MIDRHVESGISIALDASVPTDRIESIGLAILTASIVLFAAILLCQESDRRGQGGADASETSRIVGIALRARAAGRPAHADSLLASLAARGPIKSPDSDAALGHWIGVFALALGVGGLGAVLASTRRRRRTFKLVATELELPFRDDEPGAVVGAIYRIRAERATAQLLLQKALTQLECPAISAPRDMPPSTRHDAQLSGADAVEADPQPFPDLGRIVEIVAIDAS